MTDEDRSWLAPGQQVAIRSCHYASESWTTTVVERHTATQIVTGRGRFRLDDLREIGSGRGQLYPTSDPSFRRYTARELLSSLGYEVDILVRRGARTAAEVLECIEVIEGKVAEAKATITRYANALPE